MNTMPEGFRLDDLKRWITSKDPDDIDIYGRSIADRRPGRTISQVELVDIVGVTADQPTHNTTEASCRVAGGTAGEIGSVTLRCTLDDTTRTDLTLYFKIEQH